MVCAVCKKSCIKQFVREDFILCYVCKNVYDNATLKASEK